VASSPCQVRPETVTKSAVVSISTPSTMPPYSVPSIIT
jgi:hypothetical protein